jgi:hypothetical protein
MAEPVERTYEQPGDWLCLCGSYLPMGYPGPANHDLGFWCPKCGRAWRWSEGRKLVLFPEASRCETRDLKWLIERADQLAAIKERMSAEIASLRAQVAAFDPLGSFYVSDPRDEWRAQIAMLERVGGSDG